MKEEKKLEVGLVQLDSNTYSIARDREYDCQLVMMHWGNRAKGKRFYMVAERDLGWSAEKDWDVDIDSEIPVSVEDLECHFNGNRELVRRIKEMYGRYRYRLDEIVDLMWGIEKERKAAVKEVPFERDGSIKNLWEDIKSWLLLNADDPNVVCLNIRNTTEIGFVGGTKEVEKIFAKFTDIEFSKVKFHLKSKGLLKTDSEANRFTRRIAREVVKKEKLSVYSFFNPNFDDEPGFVKEFLKAREEQKASKEKRTAENQ